MNWFSKEFDQLLDFKKASAVSGAHFKKSKAGAIVGFVGEPAGNELAEWQAETRAALGGTAFFEIGNRKRKVKPPW